MRAPVMFAVACITSPCCTPLLVPLALALLAGTPVAVWLSAHMGWVLGGLTLVSIASFVLAWRWFNPKTPAPKVSNVRFDSPDLNIQGVKNMSEQPNVVIACDLNAIQPDERQQHMLTAQELFATVTEVQELADGYAFRLPTETLTLKSAANFIANERKCCPFFDFTLKVGAQSGLWLSLTGNDEVKQFVRAEFGSLVKFDFEAAQG